jgi:hypothetical protein
MDSFKVQLGLTDRTTQAIDGALARRRTTGRANLLFGGPAVIASIAYMDPGNFATNFQAGARYGYALLWVVLGVNVLRCCFRRYRPDWVSSRTATSPKCAVSGFPHRWFVRERLARVRCSDFLNRIDLVSQHDSPASDLRHEHTGLPGAG